MSALPVPDQIALVRMNAIEVAEMIELHIDYINEDSRSVHLPAPFVAHFIQRHDDVLPTVVAVATLPTVLADGGLLMADGLDRSRGIVFEIPQEVRDIMPRREDITDKDVRAAMQLLCDRWLCDVATDLAGKCIAIAAALTIIERSMLPDRPAFFVTAGRRGGGKTTLLMMLIMAVTGTRPAAAAWSTNEEERRKALLSYFLYGVPYICGITFHAELRLAARTLSDLARLPITPIVGWEFRRWYRQPLLQYIFLPETMSPPVAISPTQFAYSP